MTMRTMGPEPLHWTALCEMVPRHAVNEAKLLCSGLNQPPLQRYCAELPKCLVRLSGTRMCLLSLVHSPHVGIVTTLHPQRLYSPNAPQ